MPSTLQRIREMPLEKAAVRRANNVIRGDWLPGGYVIGKLVETTNNRYSFAIFTETRTVLPSGSVQFTVTGSLSIQDIAEDGTLLGTESRSDTGSAIAYRQFKPEGFQMDMNPIGEPIMRNGKKFLIYPPSDEQFDTAAKGAVTDCIKRCARQFGRVFWLELYLDEDILNLLYPADVEGGAAAAAHATPPGGPPSEALPLDNPGDFVVNGKQFQGKLSEIATKQGGVEYLKKLVAYRENGKQPAVSVNAEAYLKVVANAPAQEQSPPFEPPATTQAVDKTAEQAAEGMVLISTMNATSKDKWLSGLLGLAQKANWGKEQLVGHIIKHYNVAGLSVTSSSPEEAIAKLRVYQGRQLQETMKTVGSLLSLNAKFDAAGYPQDMVLDWCNKEFGKNWTDKKTFPHIVDELTPTERTKLLTKMQSAMDTLAQESAASMANEFQP